MRAIDTRTYLHDCHLLREKISSSAGYPFSIPAIAAMGTIEFHPKVTFFVGENGSGKSTLLEAHAVGLGLNAEGGSRNFAFQTRPSHSVLHEHLRICKGVKLPRDRYFMRAESFFNVATEIEELDKHPSGPPVIDSYGGRSLHEQSHGESFLAFLNHRVGKGLYLFDEPEAALSPTRQLSLLKILNDRTTDGSQFVIATHSPILLAYPEAVIYEFSASGIDKVDYRSTDTFVITSEFLKHPEKMLKILFEGT